MHVRSVSRANARRFGSGTVAALLVVLGGISGAGVEAGAAAPAGHLPSQDSSLPLAAVRTNPADTTSDGPRRLQGRVDEGAQDRPIGPDPGEGLTRLPGHVLRVLARATADSVDERVEDPSKDAALRAMTLTLVLERDDPAGFERYLKQVYDPQSKRYQHFLTQAQLTARFGPSRGSYLSVIHHLRAQGFKLRKGSANRLTVSVRGTRSQVEHTFGLRIRDYAIGDTHFYANDADPALPIPIARHVQAVTGLSSLGVPQPSIKSWGYRGCGATPGGGNGGKKNVAKCVNLVNGLYGLFRTIVCGLSTIALAAGKDPLTFGTGVVITVACNVGDLSGNLGDLGNALGSAPGPSIKLGLRSSAAGPAAVANGTGQVVGLLEFDGFSSSDVADYLALIGAPASRMQNLSTIPVNGGVATPGSGETEVLLDIDTVMTIAPGAKVAVYEAPFDGHLTSYAAVFNAMINGGVTVISNSWASCEDQVSQAEASSIDSILQTAAAGGISVFNATGDSGATCLDGSANTISVPADSPNAMAVGGTSWPNGLGPGQTYNAETWWNGSGDVPATGQGGFGVSRYFATPSYQSSLNTAAKRSVPDVVIRADPANGVFICQADDGGCPNGTYNGGTSLAAPEWAAVAALLNQAQGRNLGFLNPLIYPLSSTDAFHNATSMTSDFAHVGLGSPNLNVLSRLLRGQTTVGPPDANLSRAAQLINPTNAVLASDGSASVPADGSSQTGVLVTLLDANGYTVSGKTVMLTASGGNATISPTSGTTSVSNGSVAFIVTDATVESVTLTATDTSDGLTLPAVTLQFSVPPATSAGLNVFPTSVAADGSSTTTLTVTLKDAQGKATPGKHVNIDQGSGHSVITAPQPAVTDVTGQIQFTATDDVNESVTYTAVDATDGDLPVPGPGTVTFSGAVASSCSSNPAVGATGYQVTTFASGFPAADFFFSNINFSGCPGVVNPSFDATGHVLMPDFRTGDIYQLSLSGGAVSSGNIITNLGPSIGTPVYAKDGSLYAARFATGGGFTTGDVIQLNPSTGAIVRELATGLTCPNGLAVDPLSGDLFFDDQCFGGGSDNPSLFRLSNPGSMNPAVSVYATLPVPGGQQQIAFAPNGTIYVVSGGGSNTLQILKVSGTNNPAPAVATPLAGITPDTGGIVVGKTNSDGSAKTLLVHVGGANGGSLEEIDITSSTPTVDTVWANGDIGAGVVGPDGCYYVGAHHVLYKLGPSTGTCSLTPSSPAPALTLSPANVATNPAQGATQTFTATLKNATALAGVPVLFHVSGANTQLQQVRTDSAGRATFSYSAVNAGSDTIVALTSVPSTGSTTTNLVSNVARVTWNTGPHATVLSLNSSPGGGTVNSAVTASASLVDVSSNPAAPVAGQSIQLALGGSSCTATTAADGTASCQLTPQAVGSGVLTADFAGGSQLTAAHAHAPFTTMVGAGSTPPPTVTIAMSPGTVGVGSTATLTWSSSGATSCTASGTWSGTQATSGTQTLTAGALGTYSYTLSCTGPGGTAAASTVLSVSMQSVIVQAKSGGGVIEWRVLVLLGVLVLLRYARVRGACNVLVVGPWLLLACVGVGTVRADEAAERPAFADNLYVGIRAGDLALYFDSAKVSQRLATQGYPGISVKKDRSAAGGLLYLGYELRPLLDIELGYARRNSSIATLTGTTAAGNLQALLDSAAHALTGYGSIYSLCLRSRWEPVPRLMITPRFGGYFWNSRVTVEANGESAATTHQGGGVTLGLGASYRVWRGLELGIGADYFRGSQDNRAALYGVSLEWRPGGTR